MELMIPIVILAAALCVETLVFAVLLRRTVKERDAAKRKEAEVKTEFLSRISHDIKTPMNVIVGATALGLEERDRPEKVEECLERIQGASDFLMGLLNDLVDMSKIEMGRFHLHPKPYAFSEFMDSVRSMMEPACEKKGITFEFPEEEWNINMMVDPMRFLQLFFNLLTNAVKFTPEGGRVTFRICNYATHNERFSADYIVRDNGIGMSREFQQILFQPFAQETESWTEKRSGAGLGLAITRNIVDLMGGSIDVKSELGRGTEVRVHLEVELAEIQPEVDNGQWEMDEIRSILNGRRILLAEDHPLDTEITKRILEHVNAEVVCAENGKEALELFESHPPYEYDAILMDIRMPEMDGYTAVRKIRKVPHEDAQMIPIIAMSADDSVEDVRKCREAGMNSHLAKPVEPQKLYQVLCEYLCAPV